MPASSHVPRHRLLPAATVFPWAAGTPVPPSSASPLLRPTGTAARRGRTTGPAAAVAGRGRAAAITETTS
ncbi:hypothetical protein O1L55_09840 [Streptomyces albulus]|nr:hypothetical protein [Streptomyces noursei]